MSSAGIRCDGRGRLRHPVLRRLPAASAAAAQGHRRGQCLVRAGPARPGQGRARDLQLGRGQHHDGRGGGARLPGRLRPSVADAAGAGLDHAAFRRPAERRRGGQRAAAEVGAALDRPVGQPARGQHRAGRGAGRRRCAGRSAGGGCRRAQVQGRQHAGDALRRRRRGAAGRRTASRSRDCSPRTARRSTSCTSTACTTVRTTTAGKSAGCATRAT